MAKEDFILSEGTVVEALPNATFRVEVAGQADLIFCHLSGKMRKNFIKVLPGDRVIFEMSPYDLTKGRITRRLKPGETMEQYQAGGAPIQPVRPIASAKSTLEPPVGPAIIEEGPATDKVPAKEATDAS